MSQQPERKRWEIARDLPTYRAGPYDDRCKVEQAEQRCYRIWDHAKHGLACDFVGQAEEAAAPPPARPACDAFMCEHANECPHVCPCSAGCYCKSHTCAPPRPATSIEVRVPVYLGLDGEGTFSRDRRHPDVPEPIGYVVDPAVTQAEIASAAADRRVLAAITRKPSSGSVGILRIDLEACSRHVFDRALAWMQSGCAPLDKAASNADALVFSVHWPATTAAGAEVARAAITMRVEAALREAIAKPIKVDTISCEQALMANVACFVALNAWRWEGLSPHDRDREVAYAVARHVLQMSDPKGTPR